MHVPNLHVYTRIPVHHTLHAHAPLVACVMIMLHHKMHVYVDRKLLVYIASVMIGYHLYIELHQEDHLFDIVYYNNNMFRLPSSLHFLVSINASSTARLLQ